MALELFTNTQSKVLILHPAVFCLLSCLMFRRLLGFSFSYNTILFSSIILCPSDQHPSCSRSIQQFAVTVENKYE